MDLSHFKDAANVPGEALNAVLWAVQNGILKGTADGLLNPQASAAPLWWMACAMLS